MEDSLISVRDLEVGFGGKTILNKLNFSVQKNEILAIVGESGSGKSLTSLTMMGLLPKDAEIGGELHFENQDLLKLTSKSWREIRGQKIGMIFQEPMTSLNPSMRCGEQVAEVLNRHASLSKQAIKDKVLELFEQVKLPRANQMYSQYPHQLSGGQKQRVMIAIALACEPQLLIADEPTTALDVTVQKEILELLISIQKNFGLSIIFISHDLALVSEFADRVMVMYKGNIVETGKCETLFKNPKADYTKALLESRPRLGERLKILPTVQDFIDGDFQKEVITSKEREKLHHKLYEKQPLLEIKNLKTFYGKAPKWYRKTHVVKAVNDVSLKLYPGETLGLVGESGCGKSTLGRSILGLEKPQSGHIFYNGMDLATANSKQWKQLRKEIQIIFQDPYSSLNPRMTVGQAIEEPMLSMGWTKSKRKEKVEELLREVGLLGEHAARYPHEFSGGQRQRIGIARSIAMHPKLIVCDESVSALDVSVQAQVLNLLNRLKVKYEFTYIFISHDLAVVKFMSDQLIVMNKGKIEECGDADAIYQNPEKPYTQKLIAAIPKGI